VSGTKGFHWRGLIGFELCWFALIYLQHWAVVPVLLYMLFGMYQLNAAGRIGVALIVLAGIALDSLMLSLNVIQFSSTGWLPLWFILLWGIFALAAVEFMAKLLTRPWLAALLGASGGPLSYWGGAALSDGVLQFPLGMYSAMALIITWALIAIALGQGRRFYAQPA